jgi:hypothetical protein
MLNKNSDKFNEKEGYALEDDCKIYEHQLRKLIEYFSSISNPVVKEKYLNLMKIATKSAKELEKEVKNILQI